MRSKLVAYFSASGVTSGVAERLAEAADADLFEIKAETAYTKEDLDWQNPKSRSSVEMNDPGSRPAFLGDVEKMQDYDTIYIGFPIWWYVAPTIINTFLERYDLKGKVIIPFATSGGSDMGKTNEKLQPSCPGARLVEGKRFDSKVTKEELENWIKEVQ